MQPDKLVRIVFKRVLRSPQVADRELVDLLREAGAEAAEARRIVAFAPNCAARAWLKHEDVKWPDQYSVHHPSTGVAAVEDRPLAAEPMFAACVSVANSCSKAQLQAMFQRSTTFTSLRQFGMRTSPEGPGSRPYLQVGPLLLDAEYLAAQDIPPLAFVQSGLLGRVKRFFRGY